MPTEPAPPASTSQPLPDGAVEAVIGWFRHQGRDLPWRRADATPWGILVSEVMLQQTPVVRVLPRWQAWMDTWPTPADLAAAPRSEVLRAWDRLGYPRRALRLQECARKIVEAHGARVPSTVEELRALPGIGEYSAAAVAAFGFGHRAVVADTNIRRVLVRVLAGKERPAPSYTAAERAQVAACLPADETCSVRWNQSVMELGALVCTVRSPLCPQCPLKEVCSWNVAGRPADHDAPRRVQAFEGTDRQMRGRIMAQLRARDQVTAAELDGLDPQAPQRVARCVSSLIADGLAERAGDCLQLPS